MNDRIEEYRRDWQSGPVAPVRSARPLRFRRRRSWLLGLLVLGSGLSVFGYHSWRPWLERAARDEVNRMKTGLELAAGMRLLRQHYLAHGSLPTVPEDLLRASLSSNKPYPPGCDFWGTPYRVDRYFDGFGVRSAGPNRRLDDRDDLVRAVRYSSLVPD